jgi:Anaerobic c4-dicarboxylate membrane transporter
LDGLQSNWVDTMLLWVELLVLLASIVVGARLGGIGLGPMGGLGLFVFVFLFGLPPGGTPGTVLGMILAVITALSLMQAAGGDLITSSSSRKESYAEIRAASPSWPLWSLTS